MIGRKIKELRLMAGIKSLRQLSIKSGVTIATLSRIESNKHKQPSAATLRKIAPHLNVEAEYLLELAGIIVKETTVNSYTAPNPFIPVLASITPNLQLSDQLDIVDIYPVAQPYNDGCYFAYIVKDATETLPLDTILIIKFSAEFADSAVVAIVRGGKIYIRKTYRDGDKLTLLSDGAGTRPETVSASEVFVAGSVVLKIIKV